MEGFIKKSIPTFSLLYTASQTLKFTSVRCGGLQNIRQIHFPRHGLRNKSNISPGILFSSLHGRVKCVERREWLTYPVVRSLSTNRRSQKSAVRDKLDKVTESTSQTIKKGSVKKKRKVEGYIIQAYALAEEFSSLEDVEAAFKSTGLYTSTPLPEDADASHWKFSYLTDVPDFSGEFFVFEKGAVVFWNVDESFQRGVLECLEHLAVKKHKDFDSEGEFLGFCIDENVNKITLKSGNLHIPIENEENKQQLLLEKYTVSLGMKQAVKLDHSETQLQKFIEKLALIPENMKSKGKVQTTQKQTVKYMGELYYLRHTVLLEPEYWDPPEFLWNRDYLDDLFDNILKYLELKNRVEILKNKLSLCFDLLDNIQSAQQHQHGSRLEWIIICLIAVEIGLEVLKSGLKYITKYVEGQKVKPTEIE